MCELVPDRTIHVIWKCWILRSEEKVEYPEKKPLRAGKRTSNKLNSHIHIMFTPGFGSGRMLYHEHAISVCAAM